MRRHSSDAGGGKGLQEQVILAVAIPQSTVVRIVELRETTIVADCERRRRDR